MSFLEKVTDQLNMRWAWEKVRRAAIPGDVWIDEIELAGFEVELEQNLQMIAAQIRKGRYHLSPLRPMAFPKNRSEDGKQQVRQYFHIAARDQVAWTAVVNVVGPYLDRQMPAWSYGNRLFRSIWVDEEDGIRTRKIGRYRHSSGQIYLPFRQSWPVFRRHVYLATRAMSAKADESSNQLPEEDAEELDLQVRLKAEYRCPFVLKEYWSERKPVAGKEELFWCSIDLKKFYPSLKLDAIKNNIVEFLPIEFRAEAQRLIGSMIRFRLDTEGWSDSHLDSVGLNARQRSFNHIPTGLYVAGFLANVGLLKVDLEVAERLKKRNVAHFRFVDDHIILAYSFDDLNNWINEYIHLLKDSGTGAKLNPKKIEPKELGEFYSCQKNERRGIKIARELAASKCKLNPEFPTPLMTKTLALVSAIARTDFNLLEESELISLSDQLEHMLLVDLPEAEIPEKTRLSFAATRLMRLAECRLSNNAQLAQLSCRRQELGAKLGDTELLPERRSVLEEELSATTKTLEKQIAELDREVARAFSLLRKVLQERPDRVRLWTRAIQMCRQTGVKGLRGILSDIWNVKKENILAAEYLMANTFSLLGVEAISAARICCDPDIAEWRKKAARSFLLDIVDTTWTEPIIEKYNWFVHASWEQFCFGIYCADLIFRISPQRETEYTVLLPSRLIVMGENCINAKQNGGRRLNWVWWAVRPSLRSLSSRPDNWVFRLGQGLGSSKKSFTFWRFFPFDVPSNVIREMCGDRLFTRNVAQMAGWWHDVLRQNQNITPEFSLKSSNLTIGRALRNIQSVDKGTYVPLQEWCEVIKKISALDPADPRVGEWTALEIVRQIGQQFSAPQVFGMRYVARAKKGTPSHLFFHPANFQLPRKWLESQGKEVAPTWDQWMAIIRPHDSKTRITVVPQNQRIADSRYTPVTSQENLLFASINQVRGLGLLLYGLLKHNFELPCEWNGPGHADVLSLLPRLLLREMTCSSWTLGILQGCLQPRAMENLFILNQPQLDTYLDNDTLHDPISFLTAYQVCNAITICQTVLENNQLSTINHRARQLTPISIRQLSQPDWTKVFEPMVEGSSINE